MVKYVRNNFLLPEPTVMDLEGVNQTLWKVAEDDRKRPHYQKNIAIETLFEKIRNNCYTYQQNAIWLLDMTSPRWAKHFVMAKISYNEVAICNEDQELIVSHTRLYGQRSTSMKWPLYLSLMAKRPNALKYTSFYDQLPPEWQTYLDNCTRPEKQEALKLLAMVIKRA